MARRLIVRAAVVALTATLSPAARGAEPRAPVPVPLVVTDARGRSIPNLQAADVEITENGEARQISSLQFHGPAPRHLALLLDEYHVTPGAPAERTRAAVAAFLDRHVRPDDTVTVVRPPTLHADTPAGLQPSRAAVAQFTGRKGEYATKGTFEAEYMSIAPAFASRQRAQIVRAALESLASTMRETAGAKALIVVTEGFEQGEPSRGRTTTLRTIARAARLANMPVYILDPSAERPEASPLNAAWKAIAAQTGGMLFEAGGNMEESFGRIAADLDARYVAEFEPLDRRDGAFHDIEVRVKRKGAVVRAPSGYWAPFPASRFPTPTVRNTAHLLTPRTSGLIQTWFRMAPASPGRTRVTFAWTPRPAGSRAAHVNVEAVTFEGMKLLAAPVAPLPSAREGVPVEVSFDAPPGPVQVSMAIATEANRVLDTDVRYIDVPQLDRSRPFIAAVEFVRPRSLPEFTAMTANPHVMPTDVREFLRQDRLLIRVRAFASSGVPNVQVRLVNRVGHTLLVLPSLPDVGGAAQFELPFARYPRGEYRLEVKATSGGETVTQLLPVRLIG
jgi:VWFA-related protein